MNRMCSVHWVAWVFVVIGALNWGLIGLFNFNLVESIFGSWPMFMRLVYTLVGVSGVALLFAPWCRSCASRSEARRA